MWTDDDAGRVTDSLASLIYKHGVPEPPRGYSHSGLAVIDAVFSLRAVYDTHVIPVINRYCDRIPRLKALGARFNPTVSEFTIVDLADDLRGLDESTLIARFDNRQYSPGTKIRKATTVQTLATKLKELGLRDQATLTAGWNTPSVEKAVLAVPGVGVATWRYVLSLSMVERVKPDTMVRRWIVSVSGLVNLSDRDAGLLLEAATAHLRDRNIAVTVRAIDHFVWQIQSGRLSSHVGEPEASNDSR
jgi:hypothetical protein